MYASVSGKWYCVSRKTTWRAGATRRATSSRTQSWNEEASTRPSPKRSTAQATTSSAGAPSRAAAAERTSVDRGRIPTGVSSSADAMRESLPRNLTWLIKFLRNRGWSSVTPTLRDILDRPFVAIYAPNLTLRPHLVQRNTMRRIAALAALVLTVAVGTPAANAQVAEPNI